MTDAATMKETLQTNKYSQKRAISIRPAHPKSSSPISAQNPSDCEIQKNFDEERDRLTGMAVPPEFAKARRSY
jgi:hypothetical protein